MNCYELPFIQDDELQVVNSRKEIQFEGNKISCILKQNNYNKKSIQNVPNFPKFSKQYNKYSKSKSVQGKSIQILENNSLEIVIQKV